MSLPRTDVSSDDFTVAVRVDRSTADAVLEVRISGELDLATAPALLDAVGTHAQHATVGEVRYDLSGLQFIDAAGLRALISVAAGRPVDVVGAVAGARRVFDITEMSSVFRIR